MRIEIAVLVSTATGTTAGRRSTANEECPEFAISLLPTQTANSNPRVTEKLQLIAAASSTLFHIFIAVRSEPLSSTGDEATEKAEDAAQKKSTNAKPAGFWQSEQRHEKQTQHNN